MKRILLSMIGLYGAGCIGIGTKATGKATGRRRYVGNGRRYVVRLTIGRLLPARPKGTLANARTGRKNADGLLGDAHDAADGYSSLNPATY